MRKYFILILLTVAPSLLWSQATLSPLTPTVTQGGTVTITASGNVGTGSSWTCPGCAGTLSNQTATTVQYNAPTTITPNQMLGGYQFRPNDDVFNTNVSGRSVLVNSVHWMTDGIYDTNFGNAPAPTINCSNSGGSLATATYFVKYTYRWNFGAGLPNGESKGSPEASCSLTGPSGSVIVTAPLVPANMTGYTVYDSTTTGTEKQQAALNACVNITTNCTITTAAAGSAVPTTQSGDIGILSFLPTTRLTYFASWGVNYTNGSTPTDTLSFFYTPANNGVFDSPQFPSVTNENGWFSARTNQNADHHFVTINTTNGNMTERYQYYCSLPTTAASVNGSNVATITFGSDPRACGLYNGVSICEGGFSGADTYFNVCPVTITSINSTQITFALTHATGTASTNGSITLNTAASGCSTTGTCNSQSGIKYNAFGYSLPPISTDAAGLPLEPLVLRAQELNQAFATGGDIKHAIRITLLNAFHCGCFVWPASTNAGFTHFIPYGTRFRLRSTFPINGFTANDQVLLRQLQQYGIIDADGGITWQVPIDFGHSEAAGTAFGDVQTAVKSFTITNTVVSNNIATILASNDMAAGYSVDISGTANGAGCLNVASNTVVAASSTQFQVFTSCTNFGSASDSGTAGAHLVDYLDAIDESGLMAASSSGATTNGEVVTYTSSTGTATTNIALNGPAVGFTKDVLYIMGGTPAQQLPVVSTNGGSICTMSPSVGTLTSGCSYTPPSTVSSTSSISVTVTSTANANVAALMTVWLCPNAGCRFVQGNTGSDFTDTDGNLWKSGWGLGLSYPFIKGCCQNDASFASINNKQLWWDHLGSSLTLGDYNTEYRLPQGTYQITWRDGGTNIPLVMYIQGQAVMGSIGGGINPQTGAGGAHLPFSFVTTASVGSNNVLTINIVGDPLNAGTNGDISSISIIPGAVAPRSGGLP